MKRSLKLFALACVVAVSLAPRAHAETGAVPTDFNEVFQMIEKLILGETIDLNPIAIGSCTPTVSFGIPSINFFFAQSSLCPISGNVSFALLPTRAVVSLDVNNSSVLERVAMDVRFKTKFAKGMTLTEMTFEDGYMLIRLAQGAPVQHWTITGKGIRSQGKGIIDGKMRVNFFNGETREGYAMLKTVSRESKKAPKKKNVQLCTLSEADPTDYLVGTLDSCHVLIEKE